MKRVTRLAFVAVLLFAAGALTLQVGPVVARSIASHIQPIALTDGTAISGAAPLPVALDLDTGSGPTASTADTLITNPASDSVQSVDDGGGSLTVDSSQLPASIGGLPAAESTSVTQDDEGGWTFDLWNVAGSLISTGTGASDSGTLRVVEASSSNGNGSPHIDLIAAAETRVLPIDATRSWGRIQVYADADSAVCCALGSTTDACARGIVLNAAADAASAGGAADYEGWGGAVTCRALDGASTVTVAVEAW